MGLQQLDKEQEKYQNELAKKGFDILKKYKILYFSMEMRTGKTITSFKVCQLMKFKKVFMISKLKALSSLSEDAGLFSDCFKFLCTNFEQLHNFKTFNFKPDVIIIDEAHSLGQFPKPAERTKELKKICDGLPIIYLTGTPTPESYSQIFHQFYVSSYSPFKEYESFYKWARDYVNVTTKYYGQIQVKDYSGAYEDKVKSKINHLFLSMTQKEAGFEQEVKERFFNIEISEGSKFLMKELMEDRFVEAKDGSVIMAETEVKLQSKIHQIVSGTVIVDDKDHRVFDLSKAKFIKENYYEKYKIAIYYKFKAEYVSLLMTFGSDCLTDSPKVFKETGNEMIFASQMQSGREGVNLAVADYIIMYNIDFSAVSYFQIRQRMQTKKRDRPAVVDWLFSDTGWEKKIYDVVSNKKDFTLSYFKQEYNISSKKVEIDGVLYHVPTRILNPEKYFKR